MLRTLAGSPTALDWRRSTRVSRKKSSSAGECLPIRLLTRLDAFSKPARSYKLAVVTSSARDESILLARRFAAPLRRAGRRGGCDAYSPTGTVSQGAELLGARTPLVWKSLPVWPGRAAFCRARRYHAVRSARLVTRRLRKSGLTGGARPVYSEISVSTHGIIRKQSLPFQEEDRRNAAHSCAGGRAGAAARPVRSRRC